MKLEDIGFYTLSDARAAHVSPTSRLMRCEVLITGRCNFRCPYCRRVGGPDLATWQVVGRLRQWAQEDLFAVRFSGGEPTLHTGLPTLVSEARAVNVARIAISTNGSADHAQYDELLQRGLNDVSVSLDACCAEDGDLMAGGVKGAWDRVVETIRWLAARVYTTVGIVLTPTNAGQASQTVTLAHSLGVADVRIIPAAQVARSLGTGLCVPESILAQHPILRYRCRPGQTVRGLLPHDTGQCRLVLDDMAVIGTDHYPCIIYAREGGHPVGSMDDHVRSARASWFSRHDSHADPICRENCLDVCRDYNDAAARFHAV
jgi:pyruvate-formate lyase-activating enzyme